MIELRKSEISDSPRALKHGEDRIALVDVHFTFEPIEGDNEFATFGSGKNGKVDVVMGTCHYNFAPILCACMNSHASLTYALLVIDTYVSDKNFKKYRFEILDIVKRAIKHCPTESRDVV